MKNAADAIILNLNSSQLEIVMKLLSWFKKTTCVHEYTRYKHEFSGIDLDWSLRITPIFTVSYRCIKCGHVVYWTGIFPLMNEQVKYITWDNERWPIDPETGERAIKKADEYTHEGTEVSMETFEKIREQVTKRTLSKVFTNVLSGK